MARHSEAPECKVFVGGLPNDATTQEIEDAFTRFGSIRKVWLARRPPGFAFVEFDDARDAEDAVKGLDGARICGVRTRVELSHGGGRGRRNERGGGGGFRGGRGRGFGGGRSDGGRYRSRSPRRSRSDSYSPRRRSRSPPPRRYSPASDDDEKDRRD